MKQMHIYIVDFTKQSNWLPSFPAPITVFVESMDGGQAYKDTGAQIPDLMIVNMGAKPSHGLQTAMAIHQRKSTAQMPVWFVQTPANYQERVAAIGDVVAIEDMIPRINQLLAG